MGLTISKFFPGIGLEGLAKKGKVWIARIDSFLADFKKRVLNFPRKEFLLFWAPQKGRHFGGSLGILINLGGWDLGIFWTKGGWFKQVLGPKRKAGFFNFPLGGKTLGGLKKVWKEEGFLD